MKKILILLLFIFVTSSCFADIHRDSYFSKGIKVGNSSITVDNEGNIVVYPSLQIDGITSQIYGEYGLGFNFDNDGYVQAYDNDTGLSTYLIYKDCYGNASYNHVSGDTSSVTMTMNVTNTYYPFKDLVSKYVSGTGYVTFRNDTDNEGDGFDIGKYGAGLYRVYGVVSFLSGVTNVRVNFAFYKNNVKEAHTEFEGEYGNERATCPFGGLVSLSANDKITVKLAQSKGAGTVIYITQMIVYIERVSQ